MLRVYMVEKWRIGMLEAAEIDQQNNTLCLHLDMIGYRALC